MDFLLTPLSAGWQFATDFLVTPLSVGWQLAIVITLGAVNILLFASFFPVDDDDDDLSHVRLIDDVSSALSINHWAHIFVSNNLKSHGITFDQFMSNPRGWTQVLLFAEDKTSDDLDPLLPAQAVVYEKVLRSELDAAEQQRIQDEEVRALESKYATVSNRGQRLTSQMTGRKPPRKYRSRHQLKHA